MAIITSIFNSLPAAIAQGLIWGIMAIGVYITYKILDIADLTVDGSMCTGAAVCVMLTINGVPLPLAMICSVIAGMLTGFATGVFHTFLGIPAILAGILTQLSLYSINLKIMGGANKSLSVRTYDLIASPLHIKTIDPFWQNTIFIIAIFVIVLIAFLYWFFGTSYGCSIRATGSNPNMSRAQGINTDFNKVIGLMLSNGIVALSGALLAQYQGASDINMARGAIVIGLAAVIIGNAVFGKIFKNFALKLLAVAFGGVIYFVVYTAVIRAGFDTDLLKLLSAVVVAISLGTPHLKSKYFSKPKRGGVRNA